MNIRGLRRALLSGHYPSKLPGAVLIGEGSQRKAWRIGAYVVKARVNGGYQLDDTPPVAVLASLGIRWTRQMRAGAWVIQPYYAPDVTHRANLAVYHAGGLLEWRGHYLDIRSANCGVDARGNLVAFDF